MRCRRDAGRKRAQKRIGFVLAIVSGLGLPLTARARPNGQAAVQPRPVGTIKAVSGNTITLTADSGGELVVQAGPNAKVLRVEPGQRDLKAATAILFSDLKAGDRVIARGAPSPDGKVFLATSIITISKGDIAAKQAHEREEWLRNGVGGLVNSVDPAGGTVSITTSSLGEKKTVTIHVSSSTILRRYAPDSTKFDDAKPAPITQIKAGDQLRARGSRSADGTELTADEVVSGTFRNIAGTVSAIDAAAGTLVVQDLATKKPVTIKITPESQLRKLPAPVAQRIAIRLKGAPASGQAPGGSGEGRAETSGSGQPAGRSAAQLEGGPNGAAGANGARQGSGDFQQMINRMPAAALSDLQKGDAVMIVATEGSADLPSTAITLLAGVEPILQAAPEGNSTLLSPWSLGAAPSEPGATP
jgi:hypothetical protein